MEEGADIELNEMESRVVMPEDSDTIDDLCDAPNPPRGATMAAPVPPPSQFANFNFDDLN